jgi:hypothetical protein
VRLAARRAIVQGATAGVIPLTPPLTPPLNKRTTTSNCHCPTIERRQDDLHYSETAEKTLPLRCTETKLVTTAHKPSRYGQGVTAYTKRHQIVEESSKNRNSSSTFNNLRKPRPGNQGKSNGRTSSPRATRECRRQHDRQPELGNPTICDSSPGAWWSTGLVNRQHPEEARHGTTIDAVKAGARFTMPWGDTQGNSLLNAEVLRGRSDLPLSTPLCVGSAPIKG